MEKEAKNDQIILPPADFKKKAWIHDEHIYEDAEDYESFWEERANELVDWYAKWDYVLSKDPPYYKWFINGKLNLSYNCIDRWVEQGKGNKLAYIWESEDGEVEKYTYADLYREVNKFANRINVWVN